MLGEEKSSERDESSVDFQILVMGLLLSLLFILLLLIIVNSPHIPSELQGAASDSATRSGGAFFTRRSYFVYETLLAGMLGAYLGEIFQIGGRKTKDELRTYRQRFWAALFLGGAAAIVVGVLFPLVVLGEFEGREINSWTLVAAAGLAGNRARNVLSQVEDAISRLLTNFNPRFNEAAISNSVKTGLQEALAAPPPIKYQGFVAIDVFNSNGSVTSFDDGIKTAQLKPGSQFELRVQFAPTESELSALNGESRPIAIREGDELPLVPFRLFVDFGLIALRPEERTIDVPHRGVSGVEIFTFTVPVSAQLPLAVATDSPSLKDEVRGEINVSIYQHARYFDTVALRIVVPS
jgi:hypothetical protein